MNQKAGQAPTDFRKIENAQDLARYLDDADRRLENSPYLYHYTTLPRAIAILKSETWHLAGAADMNDRLEYENGDPARWKNLFFSCFMVESRESIGMWSMYAQPWEQGVKIAIPKNAALRWIKGVTEILEISPKNFQPTGRAVPSGRAALTLSAVAYSNADSLERKGEEERLAWSTNRYNYNIKNAVHIPELTGYVKDDAWSYEREIRVKARFHNTQGFRRVAIRLPEEVINSMVITASPLFAGDLRAQIHKEVRRQLQTDRSIFSGRLNLRNICADCTLKKRSG